MLDQLADQSKQKKLKKLDDFTEYLKEQLTSAEDFKRDNPDREDMNALIELAQAIEEEVKAVTDLVNIGEDCPEDWEDLEEARSSLTRTLDRIQHQNWLALGPSSSRRINQLVFYLKKQPESNEARTLVDELQEITRRLLGESLKPDLQLRLRKFSTLLEEKSGKGLLKSLFRQVEKLEESMDLSLLDGSLSGKECVVCSTKLTPEAESCPSCGAAVLTLEQTRTAEPQQEEARSQLMDTLNHNWKLFQCEEINQENFLRLLRSLSEPISAAVEKLDSPTAALLDFSTRLEMFVQLPDRKSLEAHWPSVLASGRALVDERLKKLEK